MSEIASTVASAVEEQVPEFGAGGLSG